MIKRVPHLSVGGRRSRLPLVFSLVPRLPLYFRRLGAPRSRHHLFECNLLSKPDRFRPTIVIPFLIMAMMITAFGCGGAGGIPSPERSPGQVAFEANCQTCHRLPGAWTKSDEEWPALVARYGPRAKINDETVSIIVAYLQKTNLD